jgi:hypothetical protein
MEWPVTEVEIFWPASLPSDPALEAETVLRDAGVQATCRLQPVRRGSEAVVVMLASAAIEPFFGAIFERLGGEVWAGLRTLVGHLLKTTTAEQPAPKSVIFESARTGAQFVFTTDLPLDAFRKAVEIDPGPEKSQWVWDAKSSSWLRF